MKSLKKNILACLFVSFLLVSFPSKSQNVGLSFSFFFPKNGEFSTPISPFSFRGVGVSLNEFVGVETGFTLYRMTGMAVKDLPFEPEKSIVGPNFTLLVPLELVLTVGLPQIEMSIKGGGFGFYSFDNKINHGNLDRAIADHHEYQLVNSSYEGENKAGFGYHFGGEVILYVFQGFGLSLEANYLVGGSDFALTGSYDYSNGSGIETVTEDFPDAKIDMTGLEISIGIIMQANSGNQNKSRNRRRR